MSVLVFNGGSTSWKSALFDDVAADARASEASAAARTELVLGWDGEEPVARGELRAIRDGTQHTTSLAVDARHADAVGALLAQYRTAGAALGAVAAVGHRVVHGGPRFHESVLLDESALGALRALEPLAPTHNALELAGIAAATRAFPRARQVAAFDTAFHRTLPPQAYTYAGPFAWLARDIRRYGFHGLSVGYAVERAAELLGREVAASRLVVAHLGGGCSLTAVRDGASIDTTMGFTPDDGVPMATRSGGVDPGILIYLLRQEAAAGTALPAAVDRLEALLTKGGGLLGLSGLSGDVRRLLAAEARGDDRAHLALDVFAYRVASAVGALVPALDRLDALVFTGGVGEHAAALRARICAPLAALGITLDAAANEAASSDDRNIAPPGAAGRVLVVTAREEWVIARECARLLERLTLPAAAGAEDDSRAGRPP